VPTGANGDVPGLAKEITSVQVDDGFATAATTTSGAATSTACRCVDAARPTTAATCEGAHDDKTNTRRWSPDVVARGKHNLIGFGCEDDAALTEP
jgi:hypothetical protein